MHKKMGVVEFRIIEDADKGFLQSLYADSREWEFVHSAMSKTERQAFLKRQYDAQDRAYKTSYLKAVHRIIVLDGEDIGRLIINRLDELMHIIDLTIHSKFTGKGIGSDILMALKAEAQGGKVPIELSVKTNNPALRLYERQGFKFMSHEGVYQKMRWFPDLSTRHI